MQHGRRLHVRVNVNVNGQMETSLELMKRRQPGRRVTLMYSRIDDAPQQEKPQGVVM